MINDSALREYLMPAPDTFWEWREAGEVITWKNGRTIAFRDELRTVLAWLAPRGLPSLDGVCLLLAATHEAWDGKTSEAHILANVLDQTLAQPEPLLRDVLLGLMRVRELENDLRTPVRAKSVLAEVVLDRCRTLVEPDVALSIVDAMRRGLGEQLTPPDGDVESRGYGPLLLLRDMADMLPGLRQIDAESLRLRLATGLDALPNSANIELSPSEMARSLLDTLCDDAEFAGLSRVAKQLLAVASLPRRLDAEENHHTGGFSDISNRGSMERLLISELANDDMTLAVRVAMNEALYLRREVPPSTPRNHRALLIDAGIRSWGVPRVFATAVALALMAGTSKGGSYTCFRSKRDSVELADLTTRQGLVEHLSALETDLHPAAAIPAYLQQIQNSDDCVEPVLVLTEDALSDDAVQESLLRADLPQLFVATVNRNGVFRLWERGRHGMKPLREAKIDLEGLFHEQTSIIARESVDDLPAIFAREPFPLLLSESVAWDRAFYVRDWGVLSATGDGRLLRWCTPSQGARQISDRIVGKILWIAPSAVNGQVSLIVGGSSNASILCVSEDNVVVQSVRLKPRAVGETYCVRNGVVFFIGAGARSVEVLDRQTGEVSQTLRLPAGVRWVRDRFFRGSGRQPWYALSHDGVAARLEQVTSAGENRELPYLITMFDQEGADGPIGITPLGDLFSTATGNVRHVRHGASSNLTVLWISTDGHRFQLSSMTPGRAGKHNTLVNVQDLTHTRGHSTLLDDRAHPIVRTTHLRHRFKAIGLDAAGNLAIESRKGHLLVFEVQQGLPVLHARGRGAELRARRGFELLRPSEWRFKLWQAEWANGSRAVLDSRGLLHLTSDDRSIPAVTLVLSEGELTGWCSDGRMWGKTYFIGEQSRRTEKSAADQYSIFTQTVSRFVERLDA